MNKKYIDFVPQKATKVKAASKITKTVKVDEVLVEEPGFGVIEDFGDLTVTKESSTNAKSSVATAKSKKISSRMPVFGKKTAARIIGEEMVKEAKPVAANIKKPAVKKAELTDEILEDAVKKAEKDEKTLNIPRAKFVNTEKVTKRPLSKNVYQRKIETPEEKPTGPVTIISKPERDSRVGLIVTIIITIILGAAAGTVAFLLLPK